MSFEKKAQHKKPVFVQDDLGMQYITVNVVVKYINQS